MPEEDKKFHLTYTTIISLHLLNSPPPPHHFFSNGPSLKVFNLPHGYVMSSFLRTQCT